MIGWLTAIAAVTLVLRMNVGIFLALENHVFSWKLRVGPFRFSLPDKEGEQKERPTKAKPKKTEKKLEKTKRILLLLKEHGVELLELVGRVLRAPALERLEVSVSAGGADPAECAMNYGRICAGVSSVLPVLHNTFEIKKQSIDVSCCYELPKTLVTAKAELVLRVYELIGLAAAFLRQIIAIKRTIQTTKKAV